MKTALMSYHYNYQYKITAVKNIGDYIQAIAARQFLSPDIWLDQNELWRYDDEPIKMIMNGWYMHAPEMFPPSEKILPLWVSAHFEPSIIENPKCVDYFKKHEPVGCRDYPTMRVFQKKGIQSYFSGCLTLTLGRTYHHVGGGKFAFVDPFLPLTGEKFTRICRRFGLMVYILLNLVDSMKIGRKMRHANWKLPHRDGGFKELVANVVYGGAFLRSYEKVFDRAVIFESDFITHLVRLKNNEDLLTLDDRLMQTAHSYLKRYEKYDCVVTSRIHCSLPCTAMGTPVIFVSEKIGRRRGDLDVTDGRLDGLDQFFNLLLLDEDWRLIPRFEWEGGRISANTKIPFNQEWKKFANDLVKRCIEFIRGN